MKNALKPVLYWSSCTVLFLRREKLQTCFFDVSDAYARMRIWGKKCYFFGKFWVLTKWIIPVNGFHHSSAWAWFKVGLLQYFWDFVKGLGVIVLTSVSDGSSTLNFSPTGTMARRFGILPPYDHIVVTQEK